MNNFVFTGPESSGKTTLAKYYAEHESGVFVPEFAREYLESIAREYVQDDLLEIAKGQYESQEKAMLQEDGFICFDTDLITIKIWSDHKYGVCDSWIKDRLLSNNNAQYVLCKPDFSWVADELRENPNDRDELFEIYLKTLKNLGLNYKIVQGGIQERISQLKSFS